MRELDDVERMRQWRERVDVAIGRLAATGQAFTVDDVRYWLRDEEPTYPNAWGARFTAAVTRGDIARVGSRPVGAARSRGRTVAVWAGVPSLHRHAS